MTNFQNAVLVLACGVIAAQAVGVINSWRRWRQARRELVALLREHDRQ